MKSFKRPRQESKHGNLHCLKSIRIRSYSGPYFLAFGLNTERYTVSLHIQSESRKIRTRIISNTDTFYAVVYHTFVSGITVALM